MALADEPQAQAEDRGVHRALRRRATARSARSISAPATPRSGRSATCSTGIPRKFPDAPGLMRRFHEAGMKVVANLKPCLLDDHPALRRDPGPFAVHDADGPADHAVLGRRGRPSRLHQPGRASRWWQDGLRAAVLASGIDVGWNDNNEYGLWDEDATCDGFGRPVPLELVRAGAGAADDARDAGAAARGAARRSAAFTITRAGCPGIQRYAQTWSGDNTTSWEIAALEPADRTADEPVRHATISGTTSAASPARCRTRSC